MKRISITAIVLLTGILMTASPVFAAGHEGGDEVSQLVPVFVKEGLDMRSYDKVLLDSLKVRDAKVVPPPWIEGDARNPKKWRLTSKDEEFLRDSYRTAMKQEIAGEGGYEIVSEPGAGVLILDVSIITLTPYARKNENVVVKGFGELLTQAQFRDGMTGELLAIYEGVQEVGSEYQQNSRLNAETSLRLLFEIWGTRVRGMLDRSR
jgi:hypothetical protein